PDPAGPPPWLRRSRNVQDVLPGPRDLLADMTPTQFHRFRDPLGEAPGFQSYTYRHLEFRLGTKAEPMVRPHKGMTQVADRLRTVLAEPSLYDAALRLLHRRGLPVPADKVERDWSRPHEADPNVA